MKHIILLLVVTASILTGCIEDSIETSPTAQPSFSTDTLSLGLLFTGENSPTYALKIYNPHAKMLSLSSISLEQGQYFRINVDGLSGTVFNNIEIRPNDSIYVFVEATLPENGGHSLPIEITDQLNVVNNGMTQSVVIAAEGQDVDRRRGCIIDRDTHLSASIPYQIFDSLVVNPGVTLTLDPGVTLYFHDKARLEIYGTLVSLGSCERPVTLRGDRRGQMAGKITYEIMSNQWSGVNFHPGSVGNTLTNTAIENTASGVTLTDSELTMTNCRLHNSTANALTAYNSPVIAETCQITNAGASVVELHGATHRFNRCTLANYYLFAIASGPIIDLRHLGPEKADENYDAPYTSVIISNSIITGRGIPLSNDDYSGYGVKFARCLFSIKGTDDDNFINTIWETDPMLDYDLTLYTFDYSPSHDSPAVGAADPTFDLPTTPTTDARGHSLGNTLGCYAPHQLEEEPTNTK